MIAWTPEEIERLEQLTRDGLSASQIATVLCREFDTGRTRNSVIGKIMRGKGRYGKLRPQSPRRASSRATGLRARPSHLRQALAFDSNKGKARLPKDPSPRPAQPAPIVAAPEPLPASVPTPLPMTFLEAVLADRCLHFVGDPLGPDGPDMPVCGAERAQDAHHDNRYCCRHLTSRHEVPATEVCETVFEKRFAGRVS